MRGRVDPADPRVGNLVHEFRHGRLSRREFLERGALVLGSLAAANSVLAACSLPPAGQSPTAQGGAATGSATNVPTAAVATGAPAATTAPAPAATDATAATPVPGAATDGLVDYEGPGEGYLAMPEGSGPFPAVVVIQEWWGLDDHIKSVADRFAGEGFVAIAPDLYHGRVASEPDEARKLAMELEQDVAIEEIQNAANYLIGRTEVSPKQVAVIGFCMGGGLALQMAAQGENFAIAAPFYGRPLDAETAAQVKIPIVGSYGEQDTGIPVDGVQTMADQIRAAGQEVDIKVYPAGHAFFNDTRESYNAEAASDAWARTLTAFREALA